MDKRYGLIDIVEWTLWTLQRSGCAESGSVIDGLERSNGKLGESIISVIENDLSASELEQLIAGLYSLAGDESKVPPGCGLDAALEAYAKIGKDMHGWIGEHIKPADTPDTIAVTTSIAMMYWMGLKDRVGYKTEDWQEAIANDRRVCRWLTEYLKRHASKGELDSLRKGLDETSQRNNADSETPVVFEHRHLLDD